MSLKAVNDLKKVLGDLNPVSTKKDLKPPGKEMI